MVPQRVAVKRRVALASLSVLSIFARLSASRLPREKPPPFSTQNLPVAASAPVLRPLVAQGAMSCSRSHRFAANLVMECPSSAYLGSVALCPNLAKAQKGRLQVVLGLVAIVQIPQEIQGAQGPCW